MERSIGCNGKDLTDAPPGYPSSARFEANFADCAARTDACPNATDGNAATDASGPTACSPLKDVHHLAQEIKALKADPENQIMVAGIFGWPRAGADGQPDLANAKYKIDLVPGPGPEDIDSQQGQVWDLWPVCYDPDHEPSDPATFEADAGALVRDLGCGSPPSSTNSATTASSTASASGTSPEPCGRSAGRTGIRTFASMRE